MNLKNPVDVIRVRICNKNLKIVPDYYFIIFQNDNDVCCIIGLRPLTNPGVLSDLNYKFNQPYLQDQVNLEEFVILDYISVHLKKVPSPRTDSLPFPGVLGEGSLPSQSSFFKSSHQLSHKDMYNHSNGHSSFVSRSEK